MKVLNDIEDTICKCHGGDKSQMEIILSDEARLVVEAPAGCGKTTTMVSKVAYMIATGTVPKNKKILALTFSVNAAYKMKKDISERLPAMGLEQIESPDDLNKLMYISNFHGLSRRILSLYGYLIDERLKAINDFKAINENDYNVDENYKKYGISITDDEKAFFADFKECILKCDYEEIGKKEDEYIDILVRRFFSRQCITFNGYLILTKRLLSINEQLREFYQVLYPVIIIDEFQDTNCLSWSLISMLIGVDTHLFFMGDSLQRIYGFIGAVPNLLDLAKEQYHMSKKVLTQNYRFKNNMEMLLLDKNIRENAKNILTPNIENDARVKLYYADTHEEECVWVADKVTHLQQAEDNCSVAVLVQQRGRDIDMIIEEFENRNMDYFYALFSDEDEEYIDYHRRAMGIFFEVLNASKYNRVSKTLLNKVYSNISREYQGTEAKLIESLLMLTKVFFERITTEYIFLGNEEKIAYISDTFENRALKQNMDLIDSKLFVSTVHGAKGLEWDYVIIPDMEPYCFPNFPSLCGSCDRYRGRKEEADACKIIMKNNDEKKILEELSVLYVAVTRVKKDLFFSASKTRYNASGKRFTSKISCLAFLPGIVLEYIS
jgi:DNA helicase-2/ATP-dependent DNA helicase PcrA